MLGAAVVGFVGFVVMTHRDAARLAEREEAALHRLRDIAASPPGEGFQAGRYHFAWLHGAGGASLLLAGPVEPGKDGLRWFATDGKTVYEFDSAVRAIPSTGPGTRGLRAYLSRSPERRREKDLPTGWRPLE